MHLGYWNLSGLKPLCFVYLNLSYWFVCLLTLRLLHGFYHRNRLNTNVEQKVDQCFIPPKKQLSVNFTSRVHHGSCRSDEFKQSGVVMDEFVGASSDNFSKTVSVTCPAKRIVFCTLESGRFLPPKKKLKRKIFIFSFNPELRWGCWFIMIWYAYRYTAYRLINLWVLPHPVTVNRIVTL